MRQGPNKQNDSRILEAKKQTNIQTDIFEMLIHPDDVQRMESNSLSVFFIVTHRNDGHTLLKKYSRMNKTKKLLLLSQSHKIGKSAICDF